MIDKILRPIRSARDYLQLPALAKKESRKDRAGLPKNDAGPRRAIDLGIEWLLRAQANSRHQDGGVARHYSLIEGWSASYPETTGYIVPTMLEHARENDDSELLESARRMLDWLVSIQLGDGGFQGGLIDSTPVVPVTFNTGQILIGLAAGTTELDGKYRKAMRRAADWLVTTQDKDGCWRKFATPFAAPGEKVYETHVSWGLYEAARIDPDRGYAEVASSNVDWALTAQKENGWFEKCCLEDPTNPLTHTLGYVLRGIIEAYRYTKEERFLRASIKTADGLLGAIRQDDGYIPGRLGPDWKGTVDWVCLTGTVQIAHCWMMLYEQTGEIKYLNAGLVANRFVRRTLNTANPEETRGAVKGSFPVNGNYGQYQYLNWATKFLVDANRLELRMQDSIS